MIVARSQGVDILKYGSGNPGATNVTRALGSKYGNIVFACDALKGFAAAAWPLLWMSEAGLKLGIIGLIASIIGHSFSVFLKFKGGKGVATTMGGLRIGGIGGAGPDRMGFHYEWDEVEIRSRPNPEIDVLLSHCPPAGTAFDRLPTGAHVGSQAVLERVQAMKGVAIFGHIHEAHGVGQIGECLCLNAGGLGPPMAHPRAGWVHGTDAVVLKDLRNGEETCAERL